MASFFPGMDPYLEAQPFWQDLQPTMITAMKAALKRRLPPGYTVWSDVYIWLHEPDALTRMGRPDVFVASRGNGGAATATLTAPASSILPAIRREGNKFLKIKEVATDRIISVIELLSPANKEGDDREVYLAKRNEYLATGTNLVEIDLLRHGERMPMGDPTPPPADYYVLVCRAAEFPRMGIWPIGVRDVLPDVPIPLKPEDGFVSLPLQECFNTAYDQGPYDQTVNYAAPPRLPLKEPDAEWAREVVREAGTRPSQAPDDGKTNS
ncbi:MAG: DUF4058 family protein [Gemmataceae bacterium]